MMAGGFFSMRSASDLLEKLGRDSEKLSATTDADTLFNFFVTAWSLHDWIAAEHPALKQSVDALFDGELLYCQEIGNKAKHFELTRQRGDPRRSSDPTTQTFDFGTLNTMPVNEGLVNGGGTRWQLAYSDRIAIDDVNQYAELVLHCLRSFFQDNNIGSA